MPLGLLGFHPDRRDAQRSGRRRRAGVRPRRPAGLRASAAVAGVEVLDHDAAVVDRIAILHEGRIIVNGTLTELTAPARRPAQVVQIRHQGQILLAFQQVVDR